MQTTYNKTNKQSLLGEILIGSRTQYIKTLAKNILLSEKLIIPLEYIDEKLRLNSIREDKPLIINYDTRLEFLIDILDTEATKGTAKLISEICSSK